MNEIAGIPYVEAVFDEQGRLTGAPAELQPGVTDVIFISHGWNNSPDSARALYKSFFESFAAVAQPGDSQDRRFAIAGVIWPSKEFDELVAVSVAPDAAQGSAAMHAADGQSQKAVLQKLAEMKTFFTVTAQALALDQAMALVPDLEGKASARRDFVVRIRSLLDTASADKDDASQSFFKEDGNELMKNLKVAEEDLDDEISEATKNAAGVVTPHGVKTPDPAGQGAAGLKDVLSGFNAAAMNLLNYTTYYEMKTRAGTIGKQGVAELVDRLAPQVQRIHLIGHSFGGRLVAATAANSSTPKIRSMALLQSAFSHNGFSKSMNGFFRAVLELERVHGPIIVTHTRNDKAVGLAYPLASRIRGDKTAAFGDENDVFGAIGRNGAQQMERGEVIAAQLLEAKGSYPFQSKKIFNLEASNFVKGHSDVLGPEVANAVRRAVMA